MNLKESNWQLMHYANAGKSYGSKHFTQADGEFTEWILDCIAARHREAREVAEIGAGTCIFASLLGKKLNLDQKVTCFEPVSELLETAVDYENVKAVRGGADEFAEYATNDTFDLIYTKDTSHHFATDTLDQVHQGICDKLTKGGRYLMVVRTPPRHDLVPVGTIASQKWSSLYTPLDKLMKSMRHVSGWTELEFTRWEKIVDTPVDEWCEGVRARDTWSVFSALDDSEIDQTLEELKSRFAEKDSFGFLHQYDVALFEKN